MRHPLLISLCLATACHNADDTAREAPDVVYTAEGWAVWTPRFQEWQTRDNWFEAEEGSTRHDLFTVATADMDLDGDLDLLFQRHHLDRMELFENTGSAFVQRNRQYSDPSGLYENPGVSDLFIDHDPMWTRVVNASVSGIVVWHDRDREGAWQVANTSARARELHLTTNRPQVEHVAAGGVVFEAVDGYTISAVFPPSSQLSVQMNQIATQLVITHVDPEPLDFFAGVDLAPSTGTELSLWKNDPHGVAWMNQGGDAQPELFVTRGGLAGNLLPPHDPKTDQLFRPSGAMAFVQDVQAIPADYCRGRQVSWMDLDEDGRDELFVSCTETPNRLLDDVDGTGVYVDRGVELGLDHVAPEAYVWLDVDDDGHLDLIQNRYEQLEVLLAVPGEAWVLRPGVDFGLESPQDAATVQTATDIFNPFTLETLDHDRDGDLDLLATRFGDAQQAALLRNDGGTFVDVTSEAGLGGATGFRTTVIRDVDADGWVDLIAVDEDRTRVWRNDAGVFSVGAEADGLVNAVPLDADLDGQPDLVGMAVGGRRRVIFDRGVGGGNLIRVDVDAPCGSAVRGHYADGTTQLQVWCTQRMSRYSQSSGPIELGSGPTRLQRITLTLPGAVAPADEVAVAAGDTRLSLSGR